MEVGFLAYEEQALAPAWETGPELEPEPEPENPT
jgi:hypothetical protein